MKSIFWKIFIRYIAIILLSFILFITFSYNTIRDITTEQLENNFALYGEQIYGYIYNNKYQLFSEKNEEQINKLREYISKIALISNSDIWICDNNGILLSNSNDKTDSRFFEYNEFDNNFHFNSEQFYINYLDTTSKMRETSVFSEVIDNKEEMHTTFIVNYNLLVFNNYPPIEENMLFYFHAPINTVNKYKNRVILSYILPFIASLSIGMILISILAINISKPIGVLNSVANLVRSGEYNKRAIITKRKDELGKLASNFNLMIDEIEKLDKSRLTFISDMSHELRTPMTTINGFISGILDGTIPYDKQPYYLKLVKEEVSRLNRLINNLLLLSKIESEEIELIKNDFDINLLIEKTITTLENIINEKNINIDIHFDEKVTYVYANEDDIERVIFNLIHNAIKFTSKRGNINIYTKIKKEATIYIEDNGIGIEQDELINIWSRFYKADKSRSADTTGTGLGLSIVKKILSNHKEGIEVKSKINEGTVFVFTLKLSKKI